MKLEMVAWWIKYRREVKTVEWDHVALGAEFRRRRKEEGVSLRALALKMKCSAPYVSDLELGRRPWSEFRILMYQGALGVIASEGDRKKLVELLKNQKPTGDFLIGSKSKPSPAVTPRRTGKGEAS